MGGALTPPTLLQLFLGYAKIGLLGFGGVAPWARHIIVEEKRWLDDREYAALLGVGQVIPGPNTVNCAIMIGDRFRGTAGAIVSALGIAGTPILVLRSPSRSSTTTSPACPVSAPRWQRAQRPRPAW